jgi:hypothetical protein
MSPFEQIAEAYRLHPQEHPFEFYDDWHSMHGFRFATPDFFIMGRSTSRFFLSRHEGTGIPLDIMPREFADTWYIHAMAGDMSKAWSILPFPLPWIAFERLREGKLELQIFPIERIHRLTHDSIESPLAAAQTG